MAFDFTCLTTFQPNSSAAHSSSVGARSVLTWVAERSNLCRSAACARYPPLMDLITNGSGTGLVTRSKRRFFLAARIASALAEYSGAAMASTKVLEISRAVSSSSGRLKASTPP